MENAQTYWKTNLVHLPSLCKFVHCAFTMVPSSASVERAFSVLKRCFGHHQRLALEDYVMTAIMHDANEHQGIRVLKSSQRVICK